MGITARAQVLLTNSSSHLVCLHTTTSRYSPELVGPQRSMPTSFQGSLGRGTFSVVHVHVLVSQLGKGGSAGYMLLPFGPDLETRRRF